MLHMLFEVTFPTLIFFGLGPNSVWLGQYQFYIISDCFLFFVSNSQPYCRRHDPGKPSSKRLGSSGS